MAVTTTPPKQGIDDTRDITGAAGDALHFDAEELALFADADGAAKMSFSDIETTGLDPDRAGITQFSSAKVATKDGTQQMQLLDVFLYPHKPIYKEYQRALAAYEAGERADKPVYDRRLYEYDINERALAVTGTRYIREAGTNSPITGMVIEQKDAQGNVTKTTDITDPCDTFAEAIPAIEGFIVKEHDLYYNAPFDKPFIYEKWLDVLAYEAFCREHDEQARNEMTPDAIALAIEECRAKLSPKALSFLRDQNAWQCILHAYQVANPNQPQNRLDNAFRELIDPSFTEREEHDAAEDIAMSAKVAASLVREHFNGDIPTVPQLYAHLMGGAEVELETLQANPWDSKKRKEKLEDLPPAIKVNASKANPHWRGFFDDYAKVQTKNNSAWPYLLQSEDDSFWVNTKKHNKWLGFTFLKKLIFFNSAMASPDAPVTCDHLRWYDKTSIVDVQIQGVDTVVEDVPLRPFQSNFAYLSRDEHAPEERFEMVQFLQALCSDNRIGNVVFDEVEVEKKDGRKEKKLEVKIRGHLRGGGEIRFTLPKDQELMQSAYEIRAYTAKLMDMGVLFGVEDARYQLDLEEEAEEEEESQRAKKETQPISFAADWGDASDQETEHKPYRIQLNHGVSQLVKFRLGEQLQLFDGAQDVGAITWDEQECLTYSGTLTEAQQKTEHDAPLSFAEVMRNASWLYYRFSEIPGVSAVKVEGDQLHLVCANGVSMPPLLTLYEARLPFLITHDKKPGAAAITLDLGGLFQDAFEVSKDLKRARQDVNDFLADKPMNAYKRRYLHAQTEELERLAAGVYAGSIAQLRMGSDHVFYVQTHEADASEKWHKLVPIGHQHDVNISYQDDQLDVLESSLLPHLSIHKTLEDGISFEFDDAASSTVASWFDAWLTQHQISRDSQEMDGVPVSISLVNDDDFPAAMQALSQLSQCYYHLRTLPASSRLILNETEPSDASPGERFSLTLDAPVAMPKAVSLFERITKTKDALEELGSRQQAPITALKQDLYKQDGKTPLFNPSQRRHQSLLALEAGDAQGALQPLGERLQHLDKLRELRGDEKDGYRYAIETIYGLQRQAPYPARSHVLTALHQVEALKDAASQLPNAKRYLPPLEELEATLKQLDNGMDRLQGHMDMLISHTSLQQNSLRRIYGDMLLQLMPEKMAECMDADGNPAKLKEQWQTYVRQACIPLKDKDGHRLDDEARSERAKQKINDAIVEHVLFWQWKDKSRRDQWMNRHPHLDVNGALRELLVHIHEPAFSETTTQRLTELCREAASIEGVEEAWWALLEQAEPYEAQMLESDKQFGQPFKDALLLSRGLASAQELYEMHVAHKSVDDPETLTKAYKNRAKEYGYLLNHELKRSSPNEVECQRLKEMSLALFKQSGLSDEEAAKTVAKIETRTKPYSESTVESAGEKDVLAQQYLQDGLPNDLEKPLAFIEIDGAIALDAEQRGDKARKEARKALEKAHALLPDPDRELKLKRKLINRMGNEQQGVIKELNDFTLAYSHAMRQLEEALFLLASHPEVRDHEGDAFWQSLEDLSSDLFTNARSQVKAQFDGLGIAYQETGADNRDVRFDIDVTPIIADPARFARLLAGVQPAMPDIVEETLEEPGADTPALDEKSPPEPPTETPLGDLPDPLREALAPLLELREAFTTMGDVSLAIEVKANEAQQEQMLQKVQKHLAIEGLEGAVRYDPQTHTLLVRCHPETREAIHTTADYVQAMQRHMPEKAEPPRAEILDFPHSAADAPQPYVSVDDAKRAWPWANIPTPQRS